MNTTRKNNLKTWLSVQNMCKWLHQLLTLNGARKLASCKNWLLTDLELCVIQFFLGQGLIIWSFGINGQGQIKMRFTSSGKSKNYLKLWFLVQKLIFIDLYFFHSVQIWEEIQKAVTDDNFIIDFQRKSV